MSKIAIVEARRTAVGSFLGSLSSFTAAQLGSVVIADILKRSKLDPSLVDDVIMGQVLQAGNGQNPARQASINAGLSVQTPAVTINHICGSGVRSVMMAAQSILAGDSEIVIAGGQENMSKAPHLDFSTRTGVKLGDITLKDSMVLDGLWCAFENYHMGVTAENIATQFSISRQEQDEFAATSQQKASRAVSEGRFVDEIVPVYIPQRKGDPIVFDTDEGVKASTTLEVLQKLRPAFNKEGSVTAGNASTINDGAAAVLIMKEDKAKELGLTPLVCIEASVIVGVEPSIMGTGPITAVQKVLKKAKWNLEEVELIEANEAFASQALCVSKELGLDPSKVNVNGGAIALGHPIGASGTRCLVSLIHEMIKQDAKKGVVTLCIGGGQGIAMAVSR